MGVDPGVAVLNLWKYVKGLRLVHAVLHSQTDKCNSTPIKVQVQFYTYQLDVLLRLLRRCSCYTVKGVKLHLSTYHCSCSFDNALATEPSRRFRNFAATEPSIALNISDPCAENVTNCSPSSQAVRKDALRECYKSYFSQILSGFVKI